MQAVIVGSRMKVDRNIRVVSFVDVAAGGWGRFCRLKRDDCSYDATNRRKPNNPKWESQVLGMPPNPSTPNNQSWELTLLERILRIHLTSDKRNLVRPAQFGDWILVDTTAGTGD